MKIKLADIINSLESLKALQEVKFPVKVSYRLKRLVDKLDPEVKLFYEKRNEMIMELGTKQEDGSTKIVEDEKLKTFAEELTKLGEVEIDVDYEPVKVEDLGDAVVAPKDLVPFVFANE